MLDTEAEVLIPLAGAHGGPGRLVRIHVSDDLPPPHKAGLRPELSELKQCGLYLSGEQALAASRAAVRRMRNGRLAGLRRMALAVANPGEVGSIAPDNARSAELGLALALVLGAARPGARVLATGRIDIAGSNRRIGPIGQLADKLRLLIDRASLEHEPALPDRFFVPATDPDGVGVHERHAAAIAQLAAIGVTVTAVSTLDEALSCLNLRMPIPARVRWGGGAAAAMIVLAAAGMSAALWFNRPAEAAWELQFLADGRIADCPLPVGFHASQADACMARSALCSASGKVTAYPTGTLLDLRFVIGTEEERVQAHLGGYGAAVIWGRANGVPRAQALEGVRLPGEPWRVELPLGAVPGDWVVAIVARRGQAVTKATINRLQQALERKLPSQPERTVNALFNALRATPGVALVYPFQTVTGEAACKA